MIKINVIGRLPGGVTKTLASRSVASAVLAAGVKEKAEINLIFVDQKKIRELNRFWRKKDKATDVLSFQEPKIPCPKDKVLLGEVFVSPAFIKETVKKEGGKFVEEVVRAIIHGVLHILGYNHSKTSERKLMFSIQESAFKMSLIKI
ncbi:MAG: rRNA maturation RNase YbeY [Patescibacteria group bacterium]